MSEVSREWELVEELLKGHKQGDFDLYDNHLSFLETIAENLDPNVDAETELYDWQIKKIYWLTEWHLNNHFVPEYEFEEDDYEDD